MELWHGCVGSDANAILTSGVNPAAGRPDTDFGTGFYLTTLRRQAEHWAWLKYYSLAPAQQATSGGPVALRFAISPPQLALLESLVFVRGDYHYGDYWSLVQQCRQGTAAAPNNHKNTPHTAPNNANWFDVVYGPVSAFWQQRLAIPDSDQISFHTTAAAAVLTNLIGILGHPDVAAYPVKVSSP